MNVITEAKGMMPDKPSTTSWMWPHNNGVQGVTINLGMGRLHWYDNPGCACGDNVQEQTIQDFLKNGALYGSPPEEVLEEMRAVLETLAV
jgi:hypothetical protein